MSANRVETDVVSQLCIANTGVRLLNQNGHSPFCLKMAKGALITQELDEAMFVW
jgi:hypothetical protein